ncbi:MAG TPA: Bor family protein [Mucilaginibacter sp.]|nr:Bor family protein [Bacteroidota bacterium]HVS94042.1 Bor family protein [Mucilaginibacter sp.]
MKKNVKITAIVLCTCLALSSCYVNTFNVGKGAQGNTTVTKWNHYLIDGLVPVEVSDPSKLAGGATDYTVTIKHSFVNGLLTSITFGIYSPTTTVVTK